MGTGGWASVGAWRSVSLDVEDSVFEDVSGSQGRWCGLFVGDNTTANVFRSSFRGFGLGTSAVTGAHLQLLEGTSVEDNWCSGVDASAGAAVTVHTGTRIANNGSGCFAAGIRVDTAATLSFYSDNVPGRRVEVVDNVGGGIDLNHHAVALLNADSLVSGNSGGWAISVRNGSMAIAPSPGTLPQLITVSGNPNGDLSCDSISHINNAAQISGATNISCANLSSDDEPGAP